MRTYSPKINARMSRTRSADPEYFAPAGFPTFVRAPSLGPVGAAGGDANVPALDELPPRGMPGGRHADSKVIDVDTAGGGEGEEAVADANPVESSSGSPSTRLWTTVKKRLVETLRSFRRNAVNIISYLEVFRLTAENGAEYNSLMQTLLNLLVRPRPVSSPSR